MMVEYESLVKRESACIAGVSYRIRRMSCGRRVELLARLRDLGQAEEFGKASGTGGGAVSAALAQADAQAALIRWGLESIENLSIDGHPADLERLLAAGPEALVHEIAAAIQDECFLSAKSRKN